MMDERIKILLRDHEPRHSGYQIEQFIIGQEVHDWHRYKQCLREISRRVEIIEDQGDAIELMKIEIRELMTKSWFSKKKTGKREIEIRQKKRHLKRMVMALISTKEELQKFVKIASEIRKKNGFGRLDRDKKRLLESEAWREKAKFMLALDLFCTGSPSPNTIEFVQKLPKKIKREIVEEVKSPDHFRRYLIEC